MITQKKIVLAAAGICLLAAGGCRATGGGVHVGGGHPQVVTGHHGPPPHAPAHGYRARHQYRYYPQEQIYFDPARRVFFYLDGPNWRMSASLPAPLQVRHSHYVIIEVEHDEPTVEFEKHRTRHPRKEKAKKHKGHNFKDSSEGQQTVVIIHQPAPVPQAPSHESRVHRYRYYPREQVYFDTGRQVYFYLDGPNWHMNATLPMPLQVSLSQFVTIETEHQHPYVEFEKHKADYSDGRNKGKEKEKEKHKGKHKRD